MLSGSFAKKGARRNEKLIQIRVQLAVPVQNNSASRSQDRSQPSSDLINLRLRCAFTGCEAYQVDRSGSAIITSTSYAAMLNGGKFRRTSRQIHPAGIMMNIGLNRRARRNDCSTESRIHPAVDCTGTAIIFKRILDSTRRAPALQDSPRRGLYGHGDIIIQKDLGLILPCPCPAGFNSPWIVGARRFDYSIDSRIHPAVDCRGTAIRLFNRFPDSSRRGL